LLPIKSRARRDPTLNCTIIGLPDVNYVHEVPGEKYHTNAKNMTVTGVALPFQQVYTKQWTQNQTSVIEQGLSGKTEFKIEPMQNSNFYM